MTEAAIRTTIASVLEEIGAVGALGPSRLAAFAAGSGDITLEELDLDSLKRMELLLALELEQGVVLRPQDFSWLESLGAIVEHIENGPKPTAAQPPTEPQGPRSHPGQRSTLRLLHRALRRCTSLTHLHRLFEGLEDRLTPLQFAALVHAQSTNTLLPQGADRRFALPVREWLGTTSRRIAASGKTEPEPFQSKRIGPAAVLFQGQGERPGKRLLIGFAGRGARSLWMPQAVLLQHMDASQCDLLVLSDPWRTCFLTGVPHLGDTIHEVVEWVAEQAWIQDYREILTLGCSSGGHPAILTGRRVGASRAVSLAGRLPTKRHLLRIGRLLWNQWRAARRHPDTPVLIVHSDDKRRDRSDARLIAWLTGARAMGVRLARPIGHNLVHPILERGLLHRLLEETIFAGSGVASADVGGLRAAEGAPTTRAAGSQRASRKAT